MCEYSFEKVKDKLTSAPILTLPKGSELVYYDVSRVDLGCMLMQMVGWWQMLQGN